MAHDSRALSSDPLCGALSRLVYSGLIQLCGGDAHDDNVSGDCDGADSSCSRRPDDSCRAPYEVEDRPHSTPPPPRPCRRCWQQLLQSMAEATVIRAKNKQWCYEIRTAPAYFSRFGRGGFPRSKNNHDQGVTIVSSYGLRRTLKSCSELGRLLLLELEASIQQHAPPRTDPQPIDVDVSALWIRPSPSHGMIYVTTPQQLWELRSNGMLPCPHCPHWFRGLWWHVQQRHLHTHAQARHEQLKHDTTRAVVVYQAPMATTTTTTTREGDAVPSSAAASTADPPDAATPSAEADAWELVKTGNLTALKGYLARHPTFDVASARDDKGAVLLHWAAGCGHLSVVQHLIRECRCDPDARQVSRRSFGGRTALHWAARNGRLDVVEHLLQDDVGADAAAETQDGTTAFGWAAWQGHLPVLRLLHAHNSLLSRSVNKFGCNAVLWAAQGTFDDPTMAVVRFLDSIGCDLYVINGNGHGLLHKAAQRGRHELAEWFVEKLATSLLEGDDASARHDNDDDNARMLRCHADLVERLLGPDAEGCTPSDLAGIEDHIDLALYLAQQERRLILLRIQGTHKAAETPALRYPSWLDRGAPVQVAGSGCYHWEAWAGVGRMREAVLAAVSSDASS